MTSPSVAGQVTGTYAGPIGRLAAFSVDSFLVVALYGVIISIVGFTVKLLSGYEIDPEGSRNLWWLAGYVLWAFLYFWVSTAITGKTVGKWLVGLRIVQRDGSPLRGRAALIRVVTFPLSFLVFGLGFLGVVIGRERRAWHDALAGTVVVHDWGDRPAEMPAPLTRFLNRRDVLLLDPAGDDTTEPASDSATDAVAEST